MAQYEMNLRDYWLIVRRRRVTIVVSMVLVALFSFWFARQKVPVYDATAAVKFEQSTSLSGLLVEVLSYSPADSIETQVALIKSYPILEEVAKRLGKLPATTTAAAIRESKAYTASLDSIAGKLRTNRVGSTSILEVTATSTNPREARDLANTVAEAYRDYNRAVRNARIVEARKFIEAQLKEVEARVKRAEEAVWAFQDANNLLSPGAEAAVLQALFTQLRGDIEKARQQRTELEVAQARLAQMDGTATTERIVVDTSNAAIQRLQAAHVELLIERNNLALEVTPKHPRLQVIDDRIREVRTQMRQEITAQVTLLRRREEILERQMTDLLQKKREVPAIELNLQRLQRDAKVNDDLLTLLKTRHQEALIKESERVEEVSVIRSANEPAEPAGTETLNTVLVGLALGLMLGLVLAFIQETLDTSIGTIEDVESYLGVPVLGVVPHIDARETVQRIIERRPALAELDPESLMSHALLITHFDPKSPVAEAYRTLRTNIQFARVERGGKVLVVTSPTLQEGKTTTIVNLALTMAQNGHRTLLVGANLRRPSIHRFFGIEREPGLADILVGTTPWRDTIRTVADILMGRFEMEDIMAAPGLDNLHIIESGPVPANPSELLSTPAMGEFLRAVREEYDIVLIDTPPVLPVTDAVIVSAQADGVVLVYQAGKVGRLVLKRAKAHLESARARVWGVVLNDIQAEIAGYAYTHHYTHYYGEEAPGGAARGPVQRARDFLGGLLGRESRSTAQRAQGAAALILAGERETAEGGKGRRRRYRDLSIGVLILGVLVAAFAGVLAWRMGWLGGAEPRALLRQKLESLPPRPGSAPESAREPSVPAPASPVPSTPSPPATVAPAPFDRPPLAPPPAPAAQAPPRVAPPTPERPAPGKDTAAASAPVPDPARFAVELGPFPVASAAERVERQLNEAGFQTVRFRQQSADAVYAVWIGQPPGVRDAQALVATLRGQGFADASVLGGPDALGVRVGDPLPLVGAVQLAERLKAKGHEVRVTALPGQETTFVIRHGNFAAREEAEAKSRELHRLGLPNQIVRVR